MLLIWVALFQLVSSEVAVYGNVTENVSDAALSAPTFTKSDRMKHYNVHRFLTSVTLRCEATGNPKPSYVWLKNGHVMDFKSKNISNPKPWALKFHLLKLSDAGNYTCIVTNIIGNIHFVFVLYVTETYPPLVYNIKPGNITTFVGNDVRFTCEYLPKDISFVSWVKFVNDSKGGCRNCLRMKRIENYYDGDGMRDLNLRSVTLKDSGEYSCRVSNTHGKSSKNVWLEVLPPVEVSLPLLSRIPYPKVFLTLAVVLAVVIILLPVMCYTAKRKRSRKKSQMRTPLFENLPDSRITQNVLQFNAHSLSRVKASIRSSSYSYPMFHEYALPVDNDWEFPKNKLKLGRVVGEGAFGVVLQGTAHGLQKRKAKENVAVKVLKDIRSQQDVANFMSEMEVMKSIGKHENIIGLLGCCTKDGAPWIIMEFAANGNLKNFLRSAKDLSDEKKTLKRKIKLKDLMSFGYQISRGMEYLESRTVIHGDLAARNVLVTKEWNMKIADFGFARDSIIAATCGEMNNSGILPLKWMAPESLKNNVFNTKTDVWSFGVVLWEIMTFADDPFPTVPSREICVMLCNGYRLERPQDCPEILYNLMMECWDLEPDRRPPFSMLVNQLDNIMKNHS